MGEPAWVAAHVFHRGDQDLLVTRAMAPLCEDLVRAGHVEDWFFLRYWEGGPHVRLRLRVDGNAGPAGRVRTAVADTCARYLAAHPSPPDGWSQHRYEVVARRRAAAERMTDWDRRLRPVDTVEFTPYRPEHHAYGSGPALRAVEQHFTDSSRTATALLSQPRDRRAAAALAMLTLATAVCEPDLPQASARFNAALRQPGHAHTGPRQPAGFHAGPRQPGHFDAGPPQHTRSHTGPPQPGHFDAGPPLPARYRDQARLLWSRASADSAPTNAAPTNPAPTNPAFVDPLSLWLDSIRSLHTTLTGLRDAFAPTDVLSPFAALARALCPDDPVVPCVVLRCTHLLCNRLGLPAPTEAHLVSLTTATLSALHQEVAPL
ncbi:MAG: hypothetical protein HOY78_20205 [Saccharothrix sp.]|nr:hypothetical protein [Saccharothrix sp.]